jgi:hypothetical protein
MVDEPKEGGTAQSDGAAAVPPADAAPIVRTVSTPLVSLDLADFGMPGVWVEVDPDVAEEMGAFEETAVSAEDVEEADDGN